jgi:hypothetical protein
VFRRDCALRRLGHNFSGGSNAEELQWCLSQSTSTSRLCFAATKHYENQFKDPSPQRHAAHQNMKRCEKVAKIARTSKADSEDGWAQFWRSNTSTVVSEDAREQAVFQ